jgi:hypothetical protein
MALMAVIMMFVLIGVAVISMTLLFATEIRRTRAAANGAQLRQLLLAAAFTAPEELQSHGTTDCTVTLPVPLPDAAAAIHIVPSGPGAATLHLTARLRDSRAAETLQMLRDQNGKWSITSAILRE